MNDSAIYDRIDELTAELSDQLTAWRHDLHRHPELSNREVETARKVTEHLRSLGLDEVRTGIAGHGVVGVLKGGRPGDRVIALRADFDALPVKETSGVDFASTVVDEDYPGGPFPVAHACGHDCHTAMLMGAASVLERLKAELPGTVLFVFQPAEEGPPIGEPGGAAQMEAEGALANPVPTMVYGHHVGPLPVGVIAYHEGNQYAASCTVRIVIHGKQVHGSTPWEGVDPLPVAAEIVSGCGQLYRQFPAADPFTVTIGHVEDMGRFNIIGESVTLLGTIRSTVEADMAGLQETMRRMADGYARAHGTTMEMDFPAEVPAVHNEPAWVEAALPTLERVVGADRLITMTPGLGYDDVSVFVNKYGGLYVGLGCQDVELTATGIEPVEGGPGMVFNHNPAFYAEDAVLPIGTRLHATVAVPPLAGRIETAA
ncbi:M20 metallopeptidase family protein [Glycomyces algeriensis]|uniref:M20 metallopeptidase family protein n=1 Tax=Glycomyces algeriensis TaxID=256037 RepID=UPI0022DAC9D4|nr:amidohydrolase [Glycomyces algeriensis]MDA1368875.1 amidohydrolase [Glycomyces algeriensis]